MRVGQDAAQLEWLRFSPSLPQVMPIASTPLTAALRDYRARHPAERDVVERFERFLATDAPVFARSHASGHFTGSAWLVSADGERVLLTHHRKLGRWLQLGGHADGDANLARVALREAEEESGLHGLRVEPAIFDLDLHLIPARGPAGLTAPHGGEAAHWHYDVRYVVRATGGEDFVVSGESLALAWQPVRALADAPATDDSLRRMARKWLAIRAR